MTFDYINRTGLTKVQVNARAAALVTAMREEAGITDFTHQEAIDAVIDAAIEHAQG